MTRAAPHAMAATPKAFTNYDLLKLLALLAMTLDHLGAYLYPDTPELRVIGRAAAPIFCFLVGWNQSYRWRTPLLLAAVMVSGLNFLHGAIFPLNILWVILLGRLLMDWLDRRERPEQAALIVVAALVWLPLVGFVLDYATVGLLWMLWGRQQRNHPGSRASAMYAVAALAGGIALMQILMALPLLYALAGAMVLAAITLYLQRFRLRALPEWRLPWVMTLSRHALIYYVVHLAVMISAALILGITPMGLRIF